jgi:hypothetical protein
LKTIAELRTLPRKQIMLELEDLIFQIDLESSFDSILGLTKDYPREWTVNLIETFMFLLPAESFALIPLHNRLVELRPIIADQSGMSESDKVSAHWDYLIKRLPNFEYVFGFPDEILLLTHYHLRDHLIGRSIVGLFQRLCHIIVFVRNAGIFNDRESERFWLTKFLPNGVSDLTENRISELVVDMVLKWSIGFELIGTSTHGLEKALPESARIIQFIPNKEQFIESILAHQVVNSINSENNLHRLLWKLQRFSKQSIRWQLLLEFTRESYFLKTHCQYSGSDIQLLIDQAVKFDIKIHNLTISESYNRRRNDELRLLGFSPKNVIESRRLFSITLDFNLTESSIRIDSSSNLSTLYQLDLISNSLIFSSVLHSPIPHILKFTPELLSFHPGNLHFRRTRLTTRF